jgi:hypothetical protein
MRKGWSDLALFFSTGSKEPLDAVWRIYMIVDIQPAPRGSSGAETEDDQSPQPRSYAVPGYWQRLYSEVLRLQACHGLRRLDQQH